MLAVEGLAVAFCDAAERRGLEPDRTFVQAGALLHDIGRTQVQDVRHASVGAEILRGDGSWPPALVHVVERHTGAGIDAEEAARLKIPVKDYTPHSLEERIVCHADNLFTGDRRIPVAQLQAAYRGKGLEAAAAKLGALHESLGRELGADLDRLPSVSLPPP